MRPVGEEVCNLGDNELNGFLKRSEKNLEIVTILAVGFTFVFPWIGAIYSTFVLAMMFNTFLLWFVVFIYFDIRDGFSDEVKRRRKRKEKKENI